jgi:hypothetical protein
MWWTVAAVLALLWGLGVLTAATMGGLIHVLLAAAVILVVVRVVLGRTPIDDTGAGH